jgi:hypothetical protein
VKSVDNRKKTVPPMGDLNAASETGNRKAWDDLGDFTTTTRLLPISALALLIGTVAAFVALALLRLIGLFTNLFYFGRWSTALVSPVGNHLGTYSVLVPIPPPADAHYTGKHRWPTAKAKTKLNFGSNR